MRWIFNCVVGAFIRVYDDISFDKSFSKTNSATELTVRFVYYQDASQYGVSNMRLVNDEFRIFQVNDIIVKKCVEVKALYLFQFHCPRWSDLVLSFLPEVLTFFFVYLWRRRLFLLPPFLLSFYFLFGTDIYL